MTKEEFLEKIQNALDEALDRGAELNPAVAIAQAALESGWGNSDLAVRANNLFGIKAGPSWQGETLTMPAREWSKQRGWHYTQAQWRKYKTYTDCLLDYAAILAKQPWFRDALAHLDDADRFLRAILPEAGQFGWATDPGYFQKVKATGASVEKMGGPPWLNQAEA